MHPPSKSTPSQTQSLLFSAFFTYATPAPKHALPVVTFFVTNATSVSPSCPGALAGPISQMDVSSASPGFTGAVKRTPKRRSDKGSPPPTAETIARAPKPNVASPWRITPPKPAAWPIAGSAWAGRGGKVRVRVVQGVHGGEETH